MLNSDIDLCLPKKIVIYISIFDSILLIFWQLNTHDIKKTYYSGNQLPKNGKVNEYKAIPNNISLTLAMSVALCSSAISRLFAFMFFHGNKMYGKSSLESNWPEPWSFVGRSSSHSGRASNIGDGLSWISRIRGGSIASVHLSVKGYGVFIVFAKRNKSHF